MRTFAIGILAVTAMGCGASARIDALQSQVDGLAKKTELLSKELDIANRDTASAKSQIAEMRNRPEITRFDTITARTFAIERPDGTIGGTWRATAEGGSLTILSPNSDYSASIMVYDNLASLAAIHRGRQSIVTSRGDGTVGYMAMINEKESSLIAGMTPKDSPLVEFRRDGVITRMPSTTTDPLR